MKTALRIVVFFFLFVGILVGFSLLIIQSSSFKDQLRKRIINLANDNLKGELRIEEISGNLWSHLKITGISLLDNDGIILQIEEIEAKYDLKKILQKKIIIHQLSIGEPYAFLSQVEAGSWNFEKLFPAQKVSSPAETRPVELKIRNIELKNGLIEVTGNTSQTTYPSQIIIPAIEGSADIFSEIQWQLQLVQIRILPQNLNIELTDVISTNPDKITFPRIEISSDHSRIISDLKVNSISQKDVIFNLICDPLDLRDIKNWLPNADWHNSLNMETKIIVNNNDLQAKIKLAADRQKAECLIQMPDIQNLWQLKAQTQFSNLNLKEWLSDLERTDLSGNLQLLSAGNSFESMLLDVYLKLENSQWQDQEIESLQITAKGDREEIRNHLELKTYNGELNIEGELFDVASEPGFDLRGQLMDFYPDKFFAAFPDSSRFNAKFDLKANGLDPETSTARIDLEIFDSKVGNLAVQKMECKADFDSNDYEIKDLYFRNSFVESRLHGKGTLSADNEIFYEVRIDSLPQEFIPPAIADIALNADIKGKFQGDFSNWKNTASLELGEFRFSDYTIENLSSDIDICNSDKEISGKAIAAVKGIKLSDAKIDSLKLDLNYEPSKQKVKIDLFQSEKLKLFTEMIFFPDGKKLNIPLLNIELADDVWHNDSDFVEIFFFEEGISVYDLILKNSAQMISISGNLAQQDENDFTITLQNIDLKPIVYEFTQKDAISGTLDLTIKLSGKLQQPQLETQILLNKPTFNDLDFLSLASRIDIQKEKLVLTLILHQTPQDSLAISGYLPLKLDYPRQIGIDFNSDFEMILQTSPLSLSWLKSLNREITELQGEINLFAVASNTLSDPHLNAVFQLRDGRLLIADNGIDYEKINLELRSDQDRIFLKDFSLESGSKKNKGSLNIFGDAQINLQEKQLDDLDFSLTARNFAALNSKELNLDLDADLRLKGNSIHPELNGRINVNRAFYFLSELDRQSAAENNLPLLVQARKTAESKESSVENKNFPQILRNLTGELMISFSRNIWLRSRDMYAELGGEIRAVKQNGDMMLIGNIQVLRGKYSFYGKRFDIIGGNVELMGKVPPNPNVFLQARYWLIDSDNVKNALIITINGTIQNPAIQFTYNDNMISELDGISYLIFGRNINELSYNEKKQLNETGGDIAAKLLAKEIIGKVTTSIQDELRLDIMEFREGKGWQDASVFVGKYLTNRLFLSFQQDFSLGRKSMLAREQLSLEYELKKQLSIQAISGSGYSTGLNLLWKYRK